MQKVINYETLQDITITPNFNSNNIAVNTEIVVNNKTQGDLIITAEMQGGSGDINTGTKLDERQSGESLTKCWWTYDGIRGNFINLSYNDKNYSVIGGSGSKSGLQKKESYYWHRDRDKSDNITWQGWRNNGTWYYNDYNLAREGQKKNIMLLFKKDSQIRINYTCYGANAFSGSVRIIPFIFR